MWFYLFVQVTDLIQGDTFATIGCVVPSLVALYKCLSSLLKTSKYHTGLIRSLQDSVGTRFAGVFFNLQMSKLPTTTPADSLPYGDRLYIIAAALDPNYGFVWLDADHPGNDALKCAIKQTTNGILFIYYQFERLIFGHFAYLTSSLELV